jgi:hypothetical protein
MIFQSGDANEKSRQWERDEAQEIGRDVQKAPL